MMLEEELSKHIIEQISQENHWRSVVELLCRNRYHKIEMPPHWDFLEASLALELKEWTKTNLKEFYAARGRTWLFKDSKDATMFTLRWLNGS